MRNYLKGLREQSGLTQKNVADMINLSRQYYCAIENGTRQKSMNINVIKKLANAFNVTVDYIIRNESDSNRTKDKNNII